MTEHYKIIKTLGEGSFGKCYLVEAQTDQALCVIKQVDLNPLSKLEQNEAFKEAKILEQLDHPNIIRFREVYKTKKNKLCIVMDFADGGDLGSKIKAQRGGNFEEADIMDWFVQICLALKHVHDRKIIHRDLKSQNIFLLKNGTVKLGDFGIAKVLTYTMENARTMVGTPYYLSPEIVENRPYSFKSDVWSLGVLLYEMCALRPPFDGTSIHSLALKIVEGRYQPLPNRYSGELRQLVASMLTRDPASRPTVHQILKNPIVRRRIEDNLSMTLRQQEFSHTILHGQNLFDNTPKSQYPAPVQETRDVRPQTRQPVPAKTEPRQSPPVKTEPRQADLKQADSRQPEYRQPQGNYRQPPSEYRPPRIDPVIALPEFRQPRPDYGQADLRQPRADYGQPQSEYRQPRQDYGQAGYKSPAEYRPVQVNSPQARPTRTPPVSFFVPIEPEVRGPPQPTEADRYIAQLRTAGSREDKRREMLDDVKRRKMEQSNKKKQMRKGGVERVYGNPETRAPNKELKEHEEREAFIYEMQEALLEQEGEEEQVELQTPETPTDRDDDGIQEGDQLAETSGLGRAEELRMRLERELGDHVFRSAYRIISDLDARQGYNSTPEYFFHLKSLLSRGQQELYVPLIKELIRLEN